MLLDGRPCLGALRCALEQSTHVDSNRAVGHAKHLPKRRLLDRQRLACLDRARSCDRKLRLRTRRLRAGAKLVVSQCPRGARQHVASIDVGVRGSDRLLGGHDAEKRHSYCVLYGELCQTCLCTIASEASFRLAHDRASQPEIERFPREQATGGAAPDALRRGRGQHWSRDRGEHRLRQKLPEDVVGRRAIRLPERIEARQVCGFRDGDICGGGVHLLERRSHGRVMLDGELKRLLERELLRRPLRVTDLCTPGHTAHHDDRSDDVTSRTQHVNGTLQMSPGQRCSIYHRDPTTLYDYGYRG